MIRLPFFLLLVSPEIVFTQWSADPTQPLIVGYGLNSNLCSDGNGGCYITYEENTGYPRHLILDRLDRFGYKPWRSYQTIQGAFDEQWRSKIIEDGSNGVIISYSDDYVDSNFMDGTERVRLQRVDSTGSVLWGVKGVRVGLTEDFQYSQELVSDGMNGCIVAWGEGNNTVRMQRVDSSGSRLWGDSGIVVAKDFSEFLLLVRDSRGGAIVSWNYGTFQRVNSTGQKLWNDSGIFVPVSNSLMVSDRSDGIIFGGTQYISYNNGVPYWSITCQRLDSDGTAVWGPSGILVADSVQSGITNPPYVDLRMNSDGTTIVDWYKQTGSDSLNTYTQSIRPDGTPVFESGGLAVSIVPEKRKIGGKWLVESLTSNTIHLFFDSRDPGGVFGQMINPLGQRLWGDSDVALLIISIADLKTTPDGRGGCIMAGWRETDFTIRAQQVSKNGILGEVITDVGKAPDNSLPLGFSLCQNYPNPFNPNTTIRYYLPHASLMKLEIFNQLGQSIQLLSSGFQVPGGHTAVFESGDLPSGVYYYRLSTENGFLVRRFTILR